MSKQNKPFLHRWLESVWYENGRGKILLLPLSTLFCFLSQRRRIKQESQQQTFDIPIIVVGNITVGGTGKTPLVIALIEQLKAQHYKPCIITRGYTGKSNHWPLLVDHNTDVELSGDEAKLMALRTHVPVIAGPNRVDDIHYVLQHTDCNIIVSDDGLQHYKMKRDIEIAVIDGERRFGNEHCLPAGPLREKPSRLKQCDLVIVNGNSSTPNEHSMQISSDQLISVDNSQHVPSKHFDKVQIYTGIGNPQRFVSHLEQKGIEISHTHFFPDHHHFTLKDFAERRDDHPIIMTEKDAVKCHDLHLDNAWYLPINAQFDTTFNEVFNGLCSVLVPALPSQ